MNDFLIKAILSLHPTAAFSTDGSGNYDGLEWLDDSIPKPTKSAVEERIQQVVAEYNNTEYKRLRAVEYPTIQEQMDMQYWDSVNGTTTWQDAIDAVKAKYPKPEGV